MAQHDRDAYCRVETITQRLGDANTLLYAQDSGSAVVVPKFIADLQRHCESFKSLQDHAFDLCRRYRYSERDIGAIETHLANLAELGFLVSKKHLLESCLARASGTDDRQSITSIAVITRNRRQFAVRCLGDQIASSREHGRDTNYLVFDDSPDADVRNEYREALRQVSERDGVDVFYAGTEEKESFAEALVEEAGAALPRNVVDFALFGTEELTYRSGANRNSSLLHTTTEAFLSLDDDVRARIASARADGDGLAILSVDDPTEMSFFPSRSEALAAVEFTGDQLLDIHERMLGRALPGCVAELAPAGPLELDGTPSSLACLLSGSGQVRATMTGVVGDCAMRSNIHYLTLEGVGYDRLVSSDAGYESLRSTREVVRVAPTWTVNDGGLLMTTAVGIDNTELLPPFFPVQRNSDVIFSNTLKLCSPDWFIGHVPWVIEHDPMESRAFSISPATRVTQTITPESVLYCLDSVARDLVSRDPAERMRTLGRRLQLLGRLYTGEFEEFLRIGRWQRLTGWVTRLEHTLAMHDDAPDSWKTDVQECIDAAHKSLLENDVVPSDLLLELPPDQALGVMQRLVFQYGELLELWPDMWEAARNLKENGRTLAVPLQ